MIEYRTLKAVPESSRDRTLCSIYCSSSGPDGRCLSIDGDAFQILV